MITISYKNDKLVHLHNILVQPELSICDTDQDNQCFVDENDPYFVGDKFLWQLCRQQTPCPPPLWFPVECMRPFWGGGGGDKRPDRVEFQNPLFKGLRGRLCPWRYFTINYYCICHCSCPCHSRNPFWCHLLTFHLSYNAISRSCHLRFFPQQGLNYATLHINSLIFKMGKWPISLPTWLSLQ